MTANQIRLTFLEFFKSKGHAIVPSAPMVVKNDPTLMFINSGMAPFKDIFLGNSPVKDARIADTQKCLRVSGKHNDLEDVGIDTYHHTMFEMLGNWSFGDYFKKEAIAWAWELLTDVYKIDKDRLYVTVFEGSKDDNLGFDQEAFDFWKQHVAEDRILKGNKKDNFWEMGEVGPCGPCSEIHYDGRPDEERKKVPGADLVNMDDPRVIEVWNNVFMEFERRADGSLVKLPKQHVDTGMGFERLVRVMQKKQSNYDTDVFTPIISKIEKLSGCSYQPLEKESDVNIAKINIAIRVIADHIRTISFSIADGQLPSNTGAGYVIRRILRRAIRYGYQSLNVKHPFMNRLVDVLAEQMGAAFPELLNQKSLIQKVIKEEETSFFRTLETGLKRIEFICDELIKSKAGKIINGAQAFELYDTFGFPIDLTSLIARGYGLSIDEEGFNKELDKQKERSRAATSISTDDWVIINDTPTIEFVGYDKTEAQVKLVKYRKINAKGKNQFQLVLNPTPFYAESGGQVGDTGTLECGSDIIHVIHTKKENNLIVHYTEQLPATLDKTFFAVVNKENRSNTASNHSATHLLHAALRKVLGTHVEQKGSLVNPEYLRFDFSHFNKISDEEIKTIEAIVNEKIRENISSDIKTMSLEDAKKTGAMALFGEKYGDNVRVVTFDKDYSIELCGGTHVRASGSIGMFKIISESAVAAGIRRIEAISGTAMEDYVRKENELLKQIREALKNPKDVNKALASLIDSNAQLGRKVESLYKEKTAILKKELKSQMIDTKGTQVLIAKVELDNADAIKDLAFQLKGEYDSLFVALGAEIEGKATLSVMLSDDLIKDKKLNAGAIIREISKEINGGGGGQPFYATAGGTNPAGIDAALKKAQGILEATI